MMFLVIIMALLAYVQAQVISTFPTELSLALKQDLFARMQKELSAVKDSEGLSSFRKAVVPVDKYSPTGFIYQSVFAGSNGPDSSCSDPSGMYGEAVNFCYSVDGFSYKYQIVEDSCSGAVIQFFADKNCDNYLGAADLSSYEGKCEESGVVFQFSKYLGYPAFQNVRCTTSLSPPVPPQPFQDPSCEGLDDVYHSKHLEGTICTYSASVGYYTNHNCSSSVATEFRFHATSCDGEDNELVALCYHTYFSDDDHSINDFVPVFDDDDQGSGCDHSQDDVITKAIQELKDGQDVLADDDDVAFSAPAFAEGRLEAVQNEYNEQKYGVKRRGLQDLTAPTDADLQAQQQVEEAGYVEGDDQGEFLGGAGEATYFLGFCTDQQQVVSLSSELVGAAREAAELTALQGRRLQSAKWVSTWKQGSALKSSEGSIFAMGWATEWLVVLAAAAVVLSAASLSLYVTLTRKGESTADTQSSAILMV